MGKIIIHADDLHRFGGIDLLFDKKSKNSISQSHLILAGIFDSHCMKILSEYLERNNLKVKSITYSADIDTIPAVCSFDFTDTIIIPQGVRIISDYSFCNCQLRKIKISSTVQKIEKKAFINFSVNEIEIDENLFYSKKGNNLVYNLTGEIIIGEEKECLPDFLVKINSKENIKIWDSLKEVYKFSVSISDYWKKEYEKIKSSLTAKDLPKGSKRLLEALQTNLRQLPDSYRSLQLLPQVDFKFGCFATDYAKITEILKAISGERRGENMDDKRNSILIYSSQLLHPGKENFYFVEMQNGIELLVPGIYLYLFFPIEEVNLIAAFIEYLAKNFINLTKNFSSNKEKQTIIKPEVISQNDRKAIIKKLSPEEFNKKKIKEFAEKRIRYLADSYDIKIQIVYEKEDVLICSEKDLERKKGIDWKIRINQSEIIYEPEPLLNKIDQQFKKMSANMVKTFV